MSNVVSVERKGEKAAIIHLDGGEKVWSPEYEKAAALTVGQPIPSDWTMKEGDYGPQAFPPRPRGGGGGAPAAYRNTKEGFEAEQAGRLRWQEREQDGLNRRTALMQAVAMQASEVAAENGSLLDLAEDFYLWLRKDQSTKSAPIPSGAVGAEAPPSSAPPTSESGGATTTKPKGKGPSSNTPASATCDHALTSDLDPLGKPLRPGWLRCDGCGLVWREEAS